MKKNAFLLAALGVVAFAGVNTAQAQSCASPLRFGFDGTSHTAVTGDTCTGSNQLGTYCSGLLDSPENDVVYAYTVDGTRTATTIGLTTTTATFNAALLVLTGTCTPNATCSTDSDTGGAGAAETVTIPTTAGNYFIIVSTSPGAGGCGAYTLTPNGRLPVALQNFSVE
jgi:hypothetical protein